MIDKAVEKFERMAGQRGITIRHSTPKEDMEDHIDLICTKGLWRKAVDIKGARKIRRDKEVQYDNVVLEILNVRGDPGFIYGKSDAIAFEQLFGFVFFNTKDLKDWSECLDRNNLTGINTGDLKMLYKGYTRKNRKDLTYLVPLNDLKRDIGFKEWK